MVETPDTATPRCTCTVDLLSQAFRPYNFLVTVWGEFPHNFTRRYRIAAPSDDHAAMCGMRLFERECMARAGVPKEVRQEVLTLDSQSKMLQ